MESHLGGGRCHQATAAPGAQRARKGLSVFSRAGGTMRGHLEQRSLIRRIALRGSIRSRLLPARAF
jgi:hypothetical protein